ncbi:MAG: hypothetical protein H6713_31565 [Myxococcales bacterium]|nr:hypothetical protein [Myxococcales bacterium]
MKTKYFARAPSLMLITALAACSGGEGETEDSASATETSETGEASETGAEQPIHAYLKETWGITLTDFEVSDFDVFDDGTQWLIDDGRIIVDGLGEQEVSTETIIDAAALGGQVSFFVSNADLSDQRYFLYDQVENYVTIGDLTKGVAVSKNPDDTYDVWAFDGDAMDSFTTVPNGYEALRLVEQYNEFKTISPYILLTAFAAAHAGTPEARIAHKAEDKNVAETPPVCEIFKEFCDCAACLVLDRAGACSPCPDL